MKVIDTSPRSSTLIFTLAIGLVMAVWLSASRPSATAQGNSGNDEEFIFGTVGITGAQTARLNVVNTATDGRTETRVLKFLDAAGNVIVDSTGHAVEATVTLAPGESAFLDLNGGLIPGIGTGRVQIRALDPTCPGCGRETPHSFIQTLEVISNVTRGTEVLYAPAQFGPPGQSFPAPFGMVGVISGQTLRLSVAWPPDPVVPTDPWRVILSFAKSNGQLVTNADGHPLQPELILQPGQSASFDLSADLILDGETRAQVRPILVVPTCPRCRIIPTLEVIDGATAKTAVLYAPVRRACGAN